MFSHFVGGAALALVMLVEVASAGVGTMSVAAAAPPPDGQSVASRAAGTWGACGTWWTESATAMTSGSVCGIDGLVADNGAPTQLAEPLISVSRYVCFRRKRGGCTSETFQGTVRRTEMTVDPLLRRATIRGTLGGCALDVEFAGIGPARPGGSLAEYHGLGDGPQIAVSGAQTFTSDAHWWGGVCGQTVVGDSNTAQASMFRGAEASISGFGQNGGCQSTECDE